MFNKNQKQQQQQQQQQKPTEIHNLVLSSEQGFAQMKPAKVTFKQECNYALQALNSNSYLQDLAMKNPQSLKEAIYNVAATDVSLSPIKKEAYLVPRIVNKKPVVCLDISYRGLVNLAVSSGGIVAVQAEVVYSGDNIKWRGKFEQPEHSFNPFVKDRGEIIGAYAVAKLHDGSYLAEHMSIDEIYSIRDKSEMYSRTKRGPWVDFEGEMIKKTVIKRAAKLYPKMSENFLKAVDVLDKNENIDFETEVKKAEERIMISYEEKFKLVEQIKNALNLVVKKKGLVQMADKMNFMKEVLGTSDFSHILHWEGVSLQKKFKELEEMLK